MSKVMVTESNLQDIADAIRSKNEGTDTYRPGDMAAAILAIPTGGGSTLVSKTITQNGEYDPEDDNADGYSDVTVNVPNSYTAGDEGKVVSSGALVAQTSTTVTENGTYDTTENNEVVVNVSGGSGGKEIDIYAFDFSPNANANTAKSGGLQISPLYDLKIVGIRFWARDNVCSVYISDISGNVIAEKQDAVVTANRWNDVLFDTPVMLEKNTSYVIWGSNQSSAMRYVGTSLSSLFVTLEAVKYSTTQDTFPTNTESGNAKYGVDLIIAFGTGIVELGTLNATQNGTYDASDDSLDGYDHVVVNVQGGGGTVPALILMDAAVSVTGNMGALIAYAEQHQLNAFSYSTQDSRKCWFRNGYGVTVNILLTKISAGAYKKLYLKTRVWVYGSGWQQARVFLARSVAMSNNLPTTGFKEIVLASQDYTSAQINAQTGVVINSEANNALEYQLVEIDISDVDEDFYIGFWNCDLNMYITDIYLEA